MTQNADDILKVLEGWAANKEVIDANRLLDAATKLTLLLGDEANELFILEKEIAEKKVKFLEDGKSVAYANLQVAADEHTLRAKLQGAKIKRIEELVRLSKLRARLADNEYRSQ